MNFLDSYDITGRSTPPVTQPEQTLNEEFSDVIGHISRFWGGFTRQARTLRAHGCLQLKFVIPESDRVSGCSERLGCSCHASAEGTQQVDYQQRFLRNTGKHESKWRGILYIGASRPSSRRSTNLFSAPTRTS